MNAFTKLVPALMGGFAFLGFLLPHALAQPPRGPMYQWGTEKKLSGTVEEVQTVQGRVPWMMGVRLALNTSEGKFTAMVGPYYVLQSQGYEPKKGDKLELVGSVLKINDQDIVIVKTLTANGKTIQLRDDQGFPLWRGGPAMRAPRGGAFGPQAPASK